jgi:hypothetical protein
MKFPWVWTFPGHHSWRLCAPRLRSNVPPMGGECKGKLANNGQHSHARGTAVITAPRDIQFMTFV